MNEKSPLKENQLKILIIENEKNDSELVKRHLESLEYECVVNTTRKIEEYVFFLEGFQPDVVISDFSISSFDGLEALKILRAQNNLTAFIFITDSLVEENAVEAIRSGATDLIVKNRLEDFSAAILRAVRKKDEKLAKEKFAKQQEINASFVSNLLRHDDWKKALLETFPLIGDILSCDRIYYCAILTNERIDAVLSFSRTEWKFGKIIQHEDPALRESAFHLLKKFKNASFKNRAYQAEVFELPEEALKKTLSAQGILSFIVVPVWVNNILIGFIGLDDCTNAGQWTVSEVAFLEKISCNLAISIEKKTSNGINTEQGLKPVASNIPGISYRCLADKNWTMLFISNEVEQVTGYPPDDFINNKLRSYASIIHPDDLDRTYLIVDQLNSREAFTLEYRLICADGSLRWIEERGLGVYDDFGKLEFIDGVIMDVTEKKKANDKFQAIFDQSTDAIFLTDENGNYIDFNKAAIKLFGYTRKELSRMNVAQLMGVPWDENFTKKWRKFLQVGQKRGTLSLSTKNGSSINISHKSVANILPGVHLSMISNITEKIRNEAQLLASERKFKALVQEGSDLLSILDLDANYLFVSESSTIAVLGFTPKDLVGRNAFEFIHPEDKELVFKQFATLKDKKQVNISPFRFRDANHQWHLLATTATNLLDDPAVGGIVANTRDVTESINQKEALKDSNERFELAMKATNEMIWDWDLKTDQVTRSRGFETIFGVLQSPSNTHSKFWLENIHEEDIYATRKSLISALENPEKEKWEKEYRIVKADGDIAYIVDQGYIIRDPNGKAVRVVGAASDITESRKMLVEISHQNNVLKEIAWTQSHIVRAPLARLMGLVELLETEDFDMPTQKKILDNISNSAAELDTIIREIVNKADQLER